MFNYKFILQISVVAILTTPAMAFSDISYTKYNKQNIIYINNDSLDEKAKIFVSKIAHKGIGIIKSGDMPEEKRQKEFRDLLHNNFDMKTIARFSLGRYWRTTSKSEQQEYLKLFEDMIVKVYSRRFSDYNGENLNVTTARMEGKSDAIVSSIIEPKNGPKISIDWRVRKKKNGTLKIVDIMVEGISMSLTQRSDFASVIQRGGGKTEILLAHLRPKN